MNNQIKNSKFASLTRIGQVCICSIDGINVTLSEFISFYKRGIIGGWIKLVQDDSENLIYQY